jgi:Na+-driven multidrug efflux pump
MLLAHFFIALAAGDSRCCCAVHGREDREEAAKSAKQGLLTGVILACVVSLLIFIFRTPLLSLLLAK